MNFLPVSKSSLLYHAIAITPTISFLLCGVAQAQIAPDRTLPNNTVVLPLGNTWEITAGTTVGNNLFHSFSEFSVPTGDVAKFDNAVNVKNVIGRITGDTISDLDGLIRANGSANLFIVNPNGIIFGENAALDLGGSFIGSTADSIQFDDGEFSAINPEASPLLTVSMPVGLQYGSEAGNITVKGSGHNAFFDDGTFTVDRFERNRGLEVAPGNTLGLIGKNVLLDGANLTAEAGNIELGSVAEADRVAIETHEAGFKFGYGELAGGKVDFANVASIDVSGNGSGDIQIYGDEVDLTDGSAIFAETEGNASGGITKIQANRLNIIGTDPSLFLPSSIWSDVYLDATGDGGSVLIDADNLYLEAGGQINVNTFSLGNAGDLTIESNLVEVIGESEEGFFISGLFAQADIFQTGRGGDISLATDSLLVTDGAQIATTTFGEGNAGSLAIEARNIELAGTSEFGISGLFASSEEEGKGGNLTIRTNSLLVNDGAQVTTIAFASGDSGFLTIEAKKIELAGTSEFGASGILAATEGSGNGGNLAIKTNLLSVADGAQIVTDTLSSADAGTLNIEAQDIKLSGESEFGASGIFGSALESTGNGGDLNLATDSLSIADGATISAGNFFSRGDGEPGQGKAGNINIRANYLEIDNKISDFPSSITASTNSGGGGNITLNIRDITLNDNSKISADTRGMGEGGNIELIGDRFSINDRAQVSVNSSGLGNAGNINLDVESFEANQGAITATSVKSGGGDVDLNTNFINLQNNSEITTSVFDGTGGGGNINITSSYILARNNSDIRANAIAGDGGNINIVSDIVLLDFDSEIDASSEFGLDGAIDVNTLETNRQIGIEAISSNIVDPSTLIAAVCPTKNTESLATTGKGGLAENPTQSIRGESVWEDLRDRNRPMDESAIIEAKAWNVNSRGQIELLSYLPQQPGWELFNRCR